MAFHKCSDRLARVASCIEPYFSLQMHAKPELTHRLQTSKMRRNWTFLNTCRRDANIVKHFALKGHFLRSGALFCALLRKEAIFAVLQRCGNEGFARMYKENYVTWYTRQITGCPFSWINRLINLRKRHRLARSCNIIYTDDTCKKIHMWW